MSLTIDEFRRDLEDSITAGAHARGLHWREAAVGELVERIVRAEVLQDWTPCWLEAKVGRGRTFELDGYSLADLDGDGSVWMISGYFPSKADDPLSTDDATRLLDRAGAFVELAITDGLEVDGSHPAAELLNVLHEKREHVRKVRVLTVTNRSLSSRFEAIKSKDLDGVVVEQQLWAIQRFHDLASDGGREPIDIDLTTYSSVGIPALAAGIGDTGYAAYLCVMPGPTLAALYGEFGTRLLEGNVRTFLSARGGVNKGIRQTILKEPDKFFAFNNGVTATATEVEVRESGGHAYLTRIKDLQIVNGGQTTASLFQAARADKASLDRIFVQVKLSVLEPQIADDLVPKISKCANTQNKVSDADLFANSSFHRRVEEISRRLRALPKPGSMQLTRWYYERARAQYDNDQLKLTEARRRAFVRENPKDQVITKTDLAKYENTWDCKPHVVSRGAQKNFVALAETLQGTYDEQPETFGDRWFQHLVAKAIIFKRMETLVSSSGWYRGAYRANIVTFGIAAVVEAVKRNGTGVVDLDRIWREQAVPDGLVAQLEAFGPLAQDVLMEATTRGKNVTEWAKSPECWSEVTKVCTELLPEFIRELKSTLEERVERTAARRQSRSDLKMATVTDVVTRAQAGYWRKACEWNALKRALDGAPARLLQLASDRGRNFVPNDTQARQLLEAAQRLIDAGWTEM